MTCQLELDQQLTQLGSHGVPCATDKDCCGSCKASRCEGSCRVEQRGGYCTLRGCTFAASVKQWACPAGSTCNRMVHGGTCLRRCDPSKPDDCRGDPKDSYGDYECYAWNNLSIRGVQVSDAPVCALQVVPCDTFGTNQGLGCTSLGLMGNPTQMLCRSLKTKQPLGNPRDPSGFCLDTTTSGP